MRSSTFKKHKMNALVAQYATKSPKTEQLAVDFAICYIFTKADNTS